jgi:hypothetical protein
MPLFGRKAKQDEPVFISRQHNKKMSTADIHDPILTAIRAEQPFEVSNDPATVQLSPQGRHRDIFGNLITDADRSNPTRPRNERPLDTIRSFEYACTGDERLREEMETPRLGWSTRQLSSMPRFESNPYAPVASSSSNNVISFTGAKTNDSYVTSVSKDDNKKKKRGFFSRKKK